MSRHIRPLKNKRVLKETHFRSLKKKLKQAQKVLISTHILPDGDGLGAETALYHYLSLAKIQCQVINPDPMPERYQFLDPHQNFIHSLKEIDQLDTADLWIIVDTNDPKRLGKLWQPASKQAKKIIFLDHHPELSGHFSHSYPPHAELVSNPAASSIGELLYFLFQELELTPIHFDVAQGLYVSVMTDTNSFRASGTTPQAHRIAAEMIELGVNPEEIYQCIYSSKKVSHLEHLGFMLQNVQSSAQGKIAWIQTTLEQREKYKTSADDTQSFLNLLLLIKEAEIICLFREEENGQIRVSIKSKGRYQVNQIAAELGGGGHLYAAGLALSLPMNVVVKTVIQEFENLILSLDQL